MPRPGIFSDLIVVHPDAPDFRTSAWWDTFKEARVFYAMGFGAAMQQAELATNAPIVDKLGAATALIAAETNWKSKFPTKKHWSEVAPSQVRSASVGEAMLLPKIAIILEALQLVADEDEALSGFDVYDLVQVVPGAYTISNFGPDELLPLREGGKADNIINAIEDEFELDRASRVLTDIASGYHVTYPIAKRVLDMLSAPRKYSLVAASRPGRRGVKPASGNLLLP